MSMVTIAEIMRIAELRGGLVTQDQLRKHGLSDRQISRLTGTRVLHSVFRGVYALEAGPWPLGRRALAACLAAPEAVVSDMTAAAHWRLRRTPRDVLEMVVRYPRQVRLAGVQVHRTNQLDARDVVQFSTGLRVTSPARTLLDIAAGLDEPTLTSLVEDALNRRLCTEWSLCAVAERCACQGRPGSALFRRVVTGRPVDRPPVGSEAELVLAEALGSAGLPTLVRPHELVLDGHGRIRLDLAVLDERFNIEIDDPHWHADPVALQRDHTRDLVLRLMGWSVQRVTTDDVQHRLQSTVAALRDMYVALTSRRLSA
jgi:hypothetical protein